MMPYTIRRWKIYAALLAALAAACCLSMATGGVPWNARGEWLWGILQLRLARTAMAVVCGAGLSVAGVIFQATLRNPLAEPYLLGVSSGAGLGAALAIILGATAAGVWALPGMAFVGAVATVLTVNALTPAQRGAVDATLLLTGVMVSAVLGSILMFLVSAAPSTEMRSVVWWLLGSLQVFDWGLLGFVAVMIAAGIVIAVLFARELNLMALGRESASHLGLRVERARKGFLLVGSLMVAAAVSACGVIGFVGLIVPHAVRMVLGADHRRLTPAAALAGAVFLVHSDSIARVVVAPVEVPIGVMTALVGGPMFLILLRRKKAGCPEVG